FHVGVQTQIAAGSYELLVRNRDIPAVAGACSRGVYLHREPGVSGHERSIGVPEGHVLCAGQVRNRRNGADVEATEIILAAQVGSFKRRRNHPGEPRDKRSLQVVAKGIAALLHGEKLFELNDGPEGVNRSAEASKLPADEQALAMMRRVGRIESVHGEAGGDLAGNNAAERVGTGETAKVDILEQQLGGGADRDQRRPIE